MDIFWFVSVVALLLAIKFVSVERRMGKYEKVQANIIKDIGNLISDMRLVFTNLAVIIPTIPKEKYMDFIEGINGLIKEALPDENKDKENIEKEQQSDPK